MNEREALIAAVRATPADDTPRLVFADWLDDHATDPAERARAEFIRLQCRAARLSPADPDAVACRYRAAELQAAYAGDWLAPLLELDWPDLGAIRFDRGFVDDFMVLVELFDIGHVWEVFLRTEYVRILTLSAPPAPLVAAAGHPVLGHFDSLWIVFIPPDHGTTAAGDGDGVVEALAGVRRVVRLRQFISGGVGFADRAVALLAGDAAFAGLESLALSDVRLTAAGLSAFRRARFAAGIRSVAVASGLWEASPTDHGAVIGDAFGAGGYAALERLSLGGYAVGDGGLSALSDSPLARRLRSIDLDGDRYLAGDGVAALFDRSRWPALAGIHLMPLFAAGEVLDRILSSDRYSTLESVQFFLQYGTPESAARFAANPHVAGLRRLGFTGGQLRDEGVRSVIRSPHLSRLESLALNGPNISEATMHELADPATLPGLRELNLTYLREISPEATAALRTRFGDRFTYDLNGAS